MSITFEEVFSAPEVEYTGAFDGERGEPDLSFDTGGRWLYRVEKDAHGFERRLVVESLAEADVISSEAGSLGYMHRPCIDVDVPIRAVPSSTPGNFHLYIEKEMTWDQYYDILDALVLAGVVERGYLNASESRGGTHLRLPWIKKKMEVSE